MKAFGQIKPYNKQHLSWTEPFCSTDVRGSRLGHSVMDQLRSLKPGNEKAALCIVIIMYVNINVLSLGWKSIQSLMRNSRARAGEVQARRRHRLRPFLHKQTRSPALSHKHTRSPAPSHKHTLPAEARLNNEGRGGKLLLKV